MRSPCKSSSLFALCLTLVHNGLNLAEPPKPPLPELQLFREDRIIVKPSSEALAPILEALGTRVFRRYPEFDNVQIIELPLHLSVERALDVLRATGLVYWAEPDFLITGAVTTPNDPKYADGTQWSLNQASDVDIDAPEAWDVRNSANHIIVAVIDSGIHTTHEDLAANLWVNTAEIAGNGVDDDNNHYVDDVYGINAISISGNVYDDTLPEFGGHGTPIAGIIGAVGNNSKGISGVAWQVKIMPLKFLNASNQGSTSDAIECIRYALQYRAHVVNASWTYPSSTFSSGLREAIVGLRNHGIPFVAAAGNESLTDLDIDPRYPASYDLDNIITVSATTKSDGLAGFSNLGLVSVHLGAPGGSAVFYQKSGQWGYWDDIYSTATYSVNAYEYFSGTSFAAPHVSGTLALMRAYFPYESYLQHKIAFSRRSRRFRASLASARREDV